MDDLEHPWLVAAWPGMGGVALLAATYLMRSIGARPIANIEPGDYFDVTHITVKDGVGRATVPENVLYAWKSPPGGRDLVIFLGDAQPAHNGYDFCRTLIGRARKLGVERVLTFAAMATPSHPKADPTVFAVTNRPALIETLRYENVELLSDGEISGLNGVLVAAAAEQDLEGICLLGEFPYFATNLPNPKASAAVLRVFSSMSGVELDLTDIDAQAAEMEERLTELLERIQQAAQAQVGGVELEDTQPSFELPEEEEETEEPGLTAPERARIEHLFEQAGVDRGKATELKAELDRLGVFKEYEDRFLDLFRRGE